MIPSPNSRTGSLSNLGRNTLSTSTGLYRIISNATALSACSKEDGNIIAKIPEGYQIKVLSKVKPACHWRDILDAVIWQTKVIRSSVIDVGCSYCDNEIYFVSLDASHVYGYDPNMERYKLGLENIATSKLYNKDNPL